MHRPSNNLANLEANVRTFLCVPIAEPLRGKLSDISNKLQQGIDVRAAWVPAENLHLTLRFLGEIKPELVKRIKQSCQNITDELDSFVVSIDRVGAFPSTARPRVVWAGGPATGHFLRLTEAVNRELSSVGFPAERNDPIPHITLARIKGRTHRSTAERIRSLKPPAGLKLSIDRIVLMQSRLGRNGASYTPIFSIPLGESGAV
jgi:2'-5' RNA ligase